MAEARTCAWCGVDISHRKHNAKFCSTAHKEKARYEKRHGRPPGPFCEKRLCSVCGAEFIAKTATKITCSTTCREAAYSEIGRKKGAARQRKYRALNPQKYRDYDRKRRYENIKQYRQKQRDSYQRLKHERPDDYHDMLTHQRERERRRNFAKFTGNLLIERAQHDPE